MKEPHEIIIINDRSDYNIRYRLGLMRKLNESYSVTSIGLFDRFYSLFYIFYKSISTQDSTFISSNLKSNLFILFLFWKKKLVILNGLGRLRKVKIFRYLLIHLINLQKNYAVIQVQNYADFRYFSRYCDRNRDIFWLPGSGGTKRLVGHNTQTISVITRDEKILNQLSSIQDFLRIFWSPKIITIIGVSNLQKHTQHQDHFDSVGYVDQSKILSFSRNILIPNGYGEGIPHCLVDAIISDANIYLSKNSFIQYGFYRFATYRGVAGVNNWVNLIVTNELKKLVGTENITYLTIKGLKAIQ